MDAPREKCGISIPVPSYSATWWWSKVEVMHQIHRSFRDVDTFVWNEKLPTASARWSAKMPQIEDGACSSHWYYALHNHIIIQMQQQWLNKLSAGNVACEGQLMTCAKGCDWCIRLFQKQICKVCCGCIQSCSISLPNYIRCNWAYHKWHWLTQSIWVSCLPSSCRGHFWGGRIMHHGDYVQLSVMLEFNDW